MNHCVKDSLNPVCNSLCLSVQYLPEIRSSVYRYLVQSRFGKSLYSFRNTSSRDQPLSHIELIMMMSYRVGPEIPLHHTECQIPVSIRDNPTDTFGDTRSVPL